MSRTLAPPAPPAPLPTVRIPVSLSTSVEMRYKVFTFDTGTTDKTLSSEASITALAVMEYSPESSRPARSFYTVVRRRTSTSSRLMRSVPLFPKAFDEMSDFIESCTPQGYTPLLVAHNAPFDTAFLHAELQRSGKMSDLPAWKFGCSLSAFRIAFPLFKESKRPMPFSQASLAERYAVVVKSEHTADDDVRVLREIAKEAQRKPEGAAFTKTLHAGASELSVWAKEYKARMPQSYDGSDCENRHAGTAARAISPRKVKLGVEEEEDQPKHVSESSIFSKAASLAAFGKEFYKFPTGKVFHIAACKLVKSDMVKKYPRCLDCSPADEERNPCRLCLVDLYQEWHVEGAIVRTGGSGTVLGHWKSFF